MSDQARPEIKHSPQVAELATKVFHIGFVDVTLWLPIAVLASGALSVLLVRRHRAREAEPVAG